MAEKYFLTNSKMPRKKIPAYLKGIVDYQGWALKMWQYWKNRILKEHMSRGKRVKEIFKKCFDKYRGEKTLKGVLDFSDLEYLVFRLLTENPEWSNILYAFDEKTDHILVDEFQDTNNFQWAIIDKLTEEWRSGMGAKREEGIMPTIFLVGDEKQSIYFFRGANVEIFQRAKKRLNNWLKDGFYYEEVKENYRSRPAIIDFTNHVFSRIMSTTGNVPSWITGYNPFKACRTDTGDTGRTEVILLDNDEAATAEVKQREADVIAKRIQSLVGSFRIKDRLSSLSSEQAVVPEPASGRLCKYMDVAVLLRRRTHLKRYEDAFRRHGIPFVIIKGIGFYQEPETAILRALVYFLSNPKDNYSLYILLKSPFFLVDEGVIIMAAKCAGIDSRDHAVSTCRENDSLLSKLKAGGYAKKAVMLLEEWLAQIPYTPVSELLEKALVQTRAWTYFHESQRRANVKKFIRLVEDLEANGKSLLKIRDFLEQTYNKLEEPKANVNIEGMDAVRIMTVHASKGLEFPMVFVPGLEEPFMLKTDDSLIYERDGKLFFKYEPESAIRKQDEDFLLHLRKEEEEQKRLFYVAVTRAEESLFLVGQWNEKDNKSFLSFLKQGLGLEKQGTGYKT
ncbi:MAG: UvrD-helicase domain-containing protein, partial [Candidatus Mariimomonas ferrooxydans]